MSGPDGAGTGQNRYSAANARPDFGQQHLREAIAARRAQLANLEAAIVADCEREAGHGISRAVRIDDRTTWDKATWSRYLTAAARPEPDYLPQMLRPFNESDGLERVVALPAPQSSIVV